MFSAKQGHYWYHFYNVFGMTQSLPKGLNPGPPTLEASTIPLGYRGGGRATYYNMAKSEKMARDECAKCTICFFVK